jgi:SagB-type dehydrogenase family enzyme
VAPYLQTAVDSAQVISLRRSDLYQALPDKPWVRFRRARTIFAYWRGKRLIFANYRTGVSVTAHPLTAQILDFFDRWRAPEDLLRDISHYSESSVCAAIDQLARYTLLVKLGTIDARQDARLARIWSTWLPYGAFHFGTKDVRFAREPQEQKLVESYFKGSSQPSFFKGYRNARRLQLPACRVPNSEFARVLKSRKTHRQFSDTALPLATLSQLLFCTWGVMGYLSTRYGKAPRKSSPSGGARHPGEVYVLALKIKRLPPGLYYYDPKNHRLLILREGDMSDKAVEYCAGQAYVKGAAALFLMTAVFPRSMWRYQFARAYRVVLLDAGHLCQTFCMTATWLGLAPFCTAALKDSLIEKDLGIDGISESVLYVAGVGTALSLKKS